MISPELAKTQLDNARAALKTASEAVVRAEERYASALSGIKVGDHVRLKAEYLEGRWPNGGQDGIVTGVFLVRNKPKVSGAVEGTRFTFQYPAEWLEKVERSQEAGG